MYPKQLFYKVLDLVDNDIAEQFRSLPEEPFNGEGKFSMWDLHEPMMMQITRDLKKIARAIDSGVAIEKSCNGNDNTNNGCNS